MSDRFFAKTRQYGNSCLIWTGAMRGSYGQFRHRGRARAAHRVAWELAHGPIPDGMQVCHLCDVRPCVNVEHLFLGTQADNMADMVAKGRNAMNYPANVGETNPMAKLQPEDVRSIRALSALGVTQREMATMFGVTIPAVSAVVLRTRWAHVE